MQPNYLVGLDIGTTKVASVVGHLTEDGKISILGVGSSPHKGLRRGSIINLEETIRAIKNAVKNAELQSGLKIDEVIVGIAGEYIESENSGGVVGTTGPDHEITSDDVKKAIKAAGNKYLPPEKKTLHVLLQQFIVDDQEGITEPVGMYGNRLEAIVHVVTTLTTPMVNIARAVEKAGYKVKTVVMEQLASSYAVLDKDEKELGVCLLDIGGGSVDMAMFYDSSIRYSAVVPWGGQHVTGDIAAGLRIPLEKAESIKINYGDAMMERNMARGDIRIEGFGGRPEQLIPHSFLGEIIVPRVEEIFGLVSEKMQKSDIIELMRAGVVLTGGTALLPGIRELAEKVFGLPVKIGVPMGVYGLQDNVSSPIFATATGLVKYGFDEINIIEDKKLSIPGKQLLSIKEKIIKIFNDFF